MVRARKAAEKAQKTAERLQRKRKTNNNDKAPNSDTCTTRSNAKPHQKKARIEDDTIDENECCVCFTT